MIYIVIALIVIVLSSFATGYIVASEIKDWRNEKRNKNRGSNIFD